MKVTGTTIQQLESGKPRSRCRKWRIWATTDAGRKSKRFNGTYSQAVDAQRAFVSDLEDIVPNDETFGAYAASWARWRDDSGNFSPNTIESDATSLRALARTELHGMRMDEITPQACRDALAWLKSHPLRVDEYSAHSMESFYNTLNSVMKQAVGDGKLARNPVDGVMRPKVGKTERVALSPGEIELLLNRIDGLQLCGHAVAVYLMACLGLRCGEACALRDDEIFGGFAHVKSTVRAADQSIGAPKSESGVRTLPMPPRLQAKVDEWRELRRRLGWSDSPTLCCNSIGGKMSTSSMRIWWAKVRGSIGCEGMVLHELRHSNLSMMARHMSPFDLQRYAGWSSIAPARIYVHDDMDAVVKAVELAWK